MHTDATGCAGDIQTEHAHACAHAGSREKPCDKEKELGRREGGGGRRERVGGWAGAVMLQREVERCGRASLWQACTSM